MESEITKKIKRRLENEGLFVQSNIDGEDEHIMIGERDGSGKKVHLIVDGKSGEIRVEDGRQTPHDLLAQVETVLTLKSGEKIRSTRTKMEFIEGQPEQADIPVLDIDRNLAPYGGSNGHGVIFTIINVSNERAIDCTWGIKGFGYEWRLPQTNAFILKPDGKELVNYKLSDEKPFNQEVPELYFFIEYRDNKGNRYYMQRPLKQTKVPSGAFFQFEVGDFQSPKPLKMSPIVSVTPMYRVDRTLLYACDFEVENNRETKVVTIAVPDSLLLGWGFNETDQREVAIRELGEKKIKKMLEEDVVTDYTFSSEDFQDVHAGGFEGYKQSRDSI